MIYPKIYETPPKFQNGLFDLNYFIEQNTRVYLRDIKVFQEKTAIALYKISIDSIGNVLEVTVKEPTASTGYFDYQSMYLDGEILRVIEMTKKWAPAKIDGKAVDSEIYLPLKFYLDGNRIVLLPSKYIFQYTNRE